MIWSFIELICIIYNNGATVTNLNNTSNSDPYGALARCIYKKQLSHFQPSLSTFPSTYAF